MKRSLVQIAALLVAGAVRGETPPAPERYLDAARTFIETMMQYGTDHYGAVHSPLFAAILDLDTRELPVQKMPDGFRMGKNGMYGTIGFGFPDMPVFIRNIDRSPFGNNMEQDVLLLHAMYELTAITGDKKYADHANAALAFWLENCQSPVTGLMASGEHSSWNFLTEAPFADVHEISVKWPFYDQLYSTDPYRAIRNAEGLWYSQIFNKKTGDFSRHAGLVHHRPEKGWNFPRHAGFYMWAYANAYAQSRDPKYIERIDLLVESSTGKRARPESLLLEPFKTENYYDRELRSLLWDAAALVPEPKRGIYRKLVREMDDESFVEEVHPRVWRWAARTKDEEAAEIKLAETLSRKWPQLLVHGRVMDTNGSLLTVSTTLPVEWRNRGPRMLLEHRRWKQTGDRRFLDKVVAAGDRYLELGFPAITTDIWPQASAGVITLMLELNAEPSIPASKRARYLAFAHVVADRSIPLFLKNGLFRADGAANHYTKPTPARAISPTR